MDMIQGFDLPDPLDLALVHAVQDGLPLVPRPYAEIGRHIGLDEVEVRSRLALLQERGDIRRLGVVVRHRELGYRANAMVVWDIPDGQVGELGRHIGAQPFVNLCYRRPRRPPQWRYNLFCMIHGQSQDAVLTNLAGLIETCDLQGIEHEVLFSLRRFKQRGARYGERGGARSVEPPRSDCRIPA
jgi:DNA-binding Lrp family transcriptional regulator